MSSFRYLVLFTAEACSIREERNEAILHGRRLLLPCARARYPGAMKKPKPGNPVIALLRTARFMWTGSAGDAARGRRVGFVSLEMEIARLSQDSVALC